MNRKSRTPSRVPYHRQLSQVPHCLLHQSQPRNLAPTLVILCPLLPSSLGVRTDYFLHPPPPNPFRTDSSHGSLTRDFCSPLHLPPVSWGCEGAGGQRDQSAGLRLLCPEGTVPQGLFKVLPSKTASSGGSCSCTTHTECLPFRSVEQADP